MKLFNLIFATLFVAQAAFGAVIADDTLTLGKSGSSANKSVRFGAGTTSTKPQIRYNTTSSKLEFSNNGTDFLGIGSGGGGAGVNLIKDNNFDAEAGTSGWTASGGTFASSTSNPFNGTRSFTWTANALSQTLYSTAVATPVGFTGRKCQIHVPMYSYTGAAGDYNLRVVDGSANVLVDQAISPTTGTNTAPAFVTFDCATPPTTVKAGFISMVASPGQIKFDDVFLGQGRSELSVSQAQIFGTATVLGTASCAWAVTGSSYAVPAADSDCPVATVTGNASAPATKIPAITFASLPPGKYVVKANFAVLPSSASHTCYMRFHDGTSAGVGTPANVYRDTTDGTASMSSTTAVEQVFEYSSAQANKTFSIQMRSSGAQTCTLGATVAADLDMAITVTYYPASANDAITLETSGWRVDAQVGNVAFDLGTAAVGTFSTVSNASGVLTNKSGAGVINASIPCTGGNVPTGTTCSAGNEQMGISWNQPTAGDVKVCFQGAWFANPNVSSHIDNNFILTETSTTSDTTIQGGNSVASAGSQSPAAGGLTWVTPLNLCETFTFTSGGIKVVKLKFMQQLTSGTLAGSSLLTDESLGGRRARWTVEPLNQGTPAPVFTTVKEKVTASANNMRVESMQVPGVCSTTPCPSIQQNGNWVTNVTRTAAGTYQINIAAGIFSGQPICSLTPMGNSFNVYNYTTNTSSVIYVAVANYSSALIDSPFTAVCMGPK